MIVERLPSFIPIASQLTELTLSHVPAFLLDSLSNNPSLLKDLPLRTNVEKVLEKMPSVWKKASVNCIVCNVETILFICSYFDRS